MTYHIGQILPLEYTRGMLGAKMVEPVWHAIVVPPMKENATVEMLKAKGVFAFYPKRESVHFRRGKKIVRNFPEITRIVYAKFEHDPQWDVMKARKWITGVFSVGDKPIAIPSEIIRRLQGLPGRAEALRQAREELQRIVIGDTAKLTEGALAGHFVQVSDVSPDGRVWWHAVASKAIRGSTMQGGLERNDNASEAEVQARADELMEPT